MSQLFSGKDILNMVLQLWADVKYHVPTGFDFSLKAVFPDFVTFLKSDCNYLIIRCNYFCLGDALRNE